ncbi:hypothetical protein GF406_10345, partial [candidate division KSB1 bacterium]|nr:hypothetical protein [candidate division KSB1 bacterium]
MNGQQPQPSYVNEGQEWTLRDYIDMIWRRWQIIALFAILGLTVSIFYVQTRPPEYRSSAVFILEPDDPSGGLPTQTRSFYYYPQIRPFEFYTALLGSQSYLDLLREQLADDEFKQRFAEVYADRHIWSFVASSVSLQQGAY